MKFDHSVNNVQLCNEKLIAARHNFSHKIKRAIASFYLLHKIMLIIATHHMMNCVSNFF